MGRLVANKGNGDCVSTADAQTATPQPIDVVLLPPRSPEAFVNIAHVADSVAVATNVRINGKPVVVLRSVIPFSFGAPPNAIEGQASGQPPNNECRFTSASATVRANGSPIVRHRDTTTQNAANCVGAVKLHEAFSLEGSGLVLDPKLTPQQREAIIENLERM